MKKFIAFIFSISCISTIAQHKLNYADVALAYTNSQGTLALSYVHQWNLGSKQKWNIGIGARFTSYKGNSQYYITAPAQLTSESTSPLILFKDNITANIDSFYVRSPQFNAINASINIGYQFNNKISVGFNIDAIGFSFGATTGGNYINGVSTKPVRAHPTPFNILLISDNDRGSLNSEFFMRYSLNEQWALKGGAQFLFTEYTTTTKVQTFPRENDRFRNKSLLFCLGISRKF